MTCTKGSLPSPRQTKPQSGSLCLTPVSCAIPKGRTYGASAGPPDRILPHLGRQAPRAGGEIRRLPITTRAT
eukprot:7061920-Pyramimonas_sp.AAC.1